MMSRTMMPMMVLMMDTIEVLAVILTTIPTMRAFSRPVFGE